MSKYYNGKRTRNVYLPGSPEPFKLSRLNIKFKYMKKNIIFLFIIFLAFPMSAGADGCIIPYNYEDIYEPSQMALLVYDNGQEDLYLKINYEGETNKFVWVVPTPHYPEVEKAPGELFIELSALTEETESWRSGDSLNAPAEGIERKGVVVHEQKQVGIYEISQGYNPLGSDQLNLDDNFALAQTGKIFLQVESMGGLVY